jgi:dipeptidase
VCDTFVADSSVTIDGSIIVGKNSDRQPNEPQDLLHVPAVDQSEEELKCTYITIPQVDHTYEVLLSKPNWIWGAEMGANEHGVVIGNEAIWSTELSKKPALIGMDLLRLGLERSKSAEDAIEQIAQLLAIHGQGGNCGFKVKEFYDNSFIIADSKEAWVLETAGKYWIAEKVQGIRTISNVITIEDKYDKIHPEFIDYAVEKGKCKSEADFNFRKQFSAKFVFGIPWFPTFAKGDKRRACTLRILEEDTGKISPQSAMNALRSHNIEEGSIYNTRASTMNGPCVHASSFLTPSQSTGSLISHVKPDQQLYWITGTSGVCTSIFKPFTLGGSEYKFPESRNTYTSDSYWWNYERLHRKIIRDYPQRIKFIEPKIQATENSFLSEIYDDTYTTIKETGELFDYSISTFESGRKNVDPWLEELERFIESNPSSSGIRQRRYRRYWNKLNKKGKLVIKD